MRCAKLDSLESVASVLNAMHDAGYAIEAPADGKELITTIMGANQRFSLTTVEEIVRKGGALKLISRKSTVDGLIPCQKRQKRMIDAWGNPPGGNKRGSCCNGM